MPTVSEAFARLLKEERQRVGVSQEALADMSGLSRSEVSVLERGKVTPRIDTLLALETALEIHGGKLLPAMRHNRVASARQVFEWIEEPAAE